MADPQSYIGATLSVAAAAAPATADKAGYEALTWVEIGNIVSMPTIGDEHADIPIDELSTGRTIHVIGSADGGAQEFSLRLNDDDLGQIALLGINGSNTNNSWRIVDPSPSDQHSYFQGLASSLKDMERTSTAYRGQTFTVMVNSPTLRTTPPA